MYPKRVTSDDFGSSAGWYPDPRGLPQLRWWDSQAWTEHTAEARGPVVAQPPVRLAFADDDRDDLDTLLPHKDEELPSRRELRELREREATAVDQEAARLTAEVEGELDELSAQPLLTMTLRELDGPSTETVDERPPGPRRSSTHTGTVAAQSTLTSIEFVEVEPPTPAAPRRFTLAAWLIALTPLLQLVTMLLLIIVLGMGSNVELMTTVVAFPFLVVLGLATFDRLQLMIAGHSRPASPLWALLGAPGYLLARGIRMFTTTGKGFAPLVLWSSSVVVVAGAVLAFPGLVLSLFPGAFSNEIALSVRESALALGGDITVRCPAPPLFVGETVSCIGAKPSGETDTIVASLQRENGWISWQVEDWGNWVIVG